MTDIVKVFEFESHALTFVERSGEWWVTTDEAREALGYSHHDQVTRLYRRNAAEFLASETCTVTLTGTGQGRETRVFSPKGLEHLAILGRTAKCKRFRRWILEVVEKLRAGAKLGDPARLYAKLAELEEKLAESQRRHIAALEDMTTRALDMTKEQSSTIAWLLGRRGVQKRLEKKLLDEIRLGQQFFPGLCRKDAINRVSGN